MATLILICKKTIFKCHQEGNINFIADIKISTPIIKEKGVMTGNFKNELRTLHYKKLNAHFLVYVCK